MKILIHSGYGDSGGLAYIMKREGAEVYLYVKDKNYRRSMEGIVPHVTTIEEGLAKKPDFVLFDLNGDGGKADEIRAKGFKVIGGSALADKLEMDRAYGTSVAKQYGLKVPETTEFNNVDEAIAFVKKNGKAYAIKIDNNKSEASSYVAKDAQDMTDYLTHSKEEGLIGAADTFVIQEVVKGAEISTELWFSNGNPVWPANSTFETKKFLAGELGQRTGCETSIVFHYDSESSRVIDKTIRKIFPLLKYSKWTGPIDVNCIVSEKDKEPYFLEWTPRLGYSAIYAFASILGIPLSNFFYGIATGSLKKIPFKALWGSSLKVSVPPYPAEIEGKQATIETYGKIEGMRINGDPGPDFIPIDVKKGKKSAFEAAGTSAIIGECLGRGSSLIQAWRGSQKVFENVELPNKQGRLTDGAEDAYKRILKLRNWGYSDIPNPSISRGDAATGVGLPLATVKAKSPL
jgi:phosphoribosylamine---glycine ligase